MHTSSGYYDLRSFGCNPRKSFYLLQLGPMCMDMAVPQALGYSPAAGSMYNISWLASLGQDSHPNGKTILPFGLYFQGAHLPCQLPQYLT